MGVGSRQVYRSASGAQPAGTLERGELRLERVARRVRDARVDRPEGLQAEPAPSGALVRKSECAGDLERLRRLPV